MQGLFGDAVAIRRKSIGVALAGEDELESKVAGAVICRDKRKGGSRELWFSSHDVAEEPMAPSM